MNDITSNISTIDIDLTSVSIATFYFDYFTLILLVAYTGTRRIDRRQGHKIETGETWSVVNLFNPELDHSLSKASSMIDYFVPC